MRNISPAPWHWGIHESHGDDSAVLESLIDAEGNEVMWLGDSARYDARSGYEPELADKYVLAAAPQLFVVAQEFLEALSELGLLCECGEVDCRTTRARAAIAKARGES